MYDFHLGLIVKRVMYFLLVLIDLFSLGVTAEALQAKINQLRSNAASLTFHAEVVPHQSFKTRLSYGVKIRTDLSSALSQFTHLTDRQTDRILIARPCMHSRQRRKI